jgi:hypothetical protein
MVLVVAGMNANKAKIVQTEPASLDDKRAYNHKLEMERRSRAAAAPERRAHAEFVTEADMEAEEEFERSLVGKGGPSPGPAPPPAPPYTVRCAGNDTQVFQLGAPSVPTSAETEQKGLATSDASSSSSTPSSSCSSMGWDRWVWGTTSVIESLNKSEAGILDPTDHLPECGGVGSHFNPGSAILSTSNGTAGSTGSVLVVFGGQSRVPATKPVIPGDPFAIYPVYPSTICPVSVSTRMRDRLAR